MGGEMLFLVIYPLNRPNGSHPGISDANADHRVRAKLRNVDLFTYPYFQMQPFFSHISINPPYST